jgi:transcriptional regulator with XRE-family HTH domain
MNVVSTESRKKSWRPALERVRLQTALAIQRENVMQRLVRLREEGGHPDKAGEPLPQDQAAARAGVTARQWQRWESGVSVPYARNLSAVADAFDFDVSEFYDGPAGQDEAPTPDPFEAGTSPLERRIEALEQELREQGARYGGLIEQQNQLLARQSQVLDDIQRLLSIQQDAADRMSAAAAHLSALEPLRLEPEPERAGTPPQVE